VASQMLIGIGNDLVHIPRVKAVFMKYGERFLKRMCHPDEIVAFKQRQGENSYSFLASLWAVKESTYKAFGGYDRKRLAFPDIRVGREASGKPSLHLEGKACELQAEFGVDRLHVSVSHDHHYALANVILERTITSTRPAS